MRAAQAAPAGSEHLARRPTRRDKLFASSATALRSLGRLALSVGVARALGAESFATYALLLVVETIALTLASCRSQAPLATLAPQLDAPGQRALLALAWRRQVEDLRLGGALALCLAPVAARWLPLPLLLGFGLQTALACLARTHQGWRLATFSAHRVLLAEACALGAPLALCAAALAGADLGLDALYASLALGQGLALAALWESPAGAGSPPAALEAEVQALSGAMLKGSLAYSLSSRLQPFALGASGGAAAVAPFAAALTLAGPLRVLSAAVDTVLRPRLAQAQGDAPQQRALLGRALGVQLGAGLAGLLVVSLCGQPLLDLAYGGVIPRLAAASLAALVYVSLESLGSTLTVAAQVQGGACGAAAATRLRIAASLASLIAVWPACAWGGVAGAFAQLCGVELCFSLGLGRLLLRGGARPLVWAR